MEKELQVGPRGGYYWVDELGAKHYVKRNGKKPKITKKVKATPETHTFICYYEKRNKDGELVDDFKEWTVAANEQEALNEFTSRYYESIEMGSIQIAHILQKT